MTENISPSENPTLADEVLETVDDICRESGLSLFLFGGTCLGFYRDGTYVSDNDLDLAVVSSEEEHYALWKRLANRSGWTDGCGLRKGPMQVDLHYTDKSLPHYVIPSWRPKPYTFNGFDTVTYHGRTYRMPSPVEKYLEWEFGKTWRVPASREVWSTVDTILQTLLLEETNG